jgi:hypothetical protein
MYRREYTVKMVGSYVAEIGHCGSAYTRHAFTILNVNGIDETVLKNRHAYSITGVDLHKC